MWIYDYHSEKDNPYREPPFVDIVHMCYADNLPLWTYAWHVHDDSYELGFITKGKGSLNIGHLEFPVELGSITVVPPKVMHHFSSNSPEGMQYYTLRFRAEPENGEMQTFFRSLGCAATSGFNYLSYIKNTFQLLFHLHQSNNGIVEETFQTICLALFRLTKTLFTHKAMTLRLDSNFSVGDILSYIWDNGSKKITLESLAREFHVSPSHLSRIFCNAYHFSPINYLIHYRITTATEYLSKSSMSIAEISEKVGYDNPTHFANLFIKKIGCTPTEYRERTRKMPLIG